jgi:hypothetical protein
MGRSCVERCETLDAGREDQAKKLVEAAGGVNHAPEKKA